MRSCGVCVVLVAAVAVLCVAQPTIGDCDDSVPRVRFADLQSMEDEPIDITPFLDVPVDHEIGRAKPMIPDPAPITSTCPFGSKCDEPPASPSSAPSHSASPSPVAQDKEDLKQQAQQEVARQDADDEAEAVAPRDDFEPSASPVPPSPPPPASPSPSPSAPPKPLSAGPDGLALAPRVEGSVVAESIQKQKEQEMDEAIDKATELALAASPTPPPVPSPPQSSVDEPIIKLDADPNVGLMFDYNDKVGDETPQYVAPSPIAQAPPEPFIEPSDSPSITPSPSVSPSLTEYDATIEHEFANCDEEELSDPEPATTSSTAPTTERDMLSQRRSISSLRGQTLPPTRIGHRNLALPPTPVFEQLPKETQETTQDPAQIQTLVPSTPSREDMRTMLDFKNYQVYSLQKPYEPQPGVRRSFRKLSIAADEMGSYEPTLSGLSKVQESASKLAGQILTTQSPLHHDALVAEAEQRGESTVPAADDASSTGNHAIIVEEFRANELAANVSWALMNQPVMPDKHVAEQHDDPIVVPPIVQEEEAEDKRIVMVPKPRLFNVTRPMNATRRNVTSEMFSTPTPTTEHTKHALPEPELPTQVPAPSASPSPLPPLPSVSPQPSPVVGHNEEGVMPENPTWMVDVNRNVVMHPIEVAEVPEDSKNSYIGNAGEFVRVSGVTPSHKHGESMPGSTKVDNESPACNDNDNEDADNTAEQAPMIAGPDCVSRASCGECVVDTGCVWCPALNGCYAGSSTGPSSVFECARDFVYGSCSSSLFGERETPQLIRREAVAQVVSCDD